MFTSLNARSLPLRLSPLLKFHLLGCHLSLVVWTGPGLGGDNAISVDLHRTSGDGVCALMEKGAGVK